MILSQSRSMAQTRRLSRTELVMQSLVCLEGALWPNHAWERLRVCRYDHHTSVHVGMIIIPTLQR